MTTRKLTTPLILLTCSLLVAVWPARAATVLKPGDRVAVVGDSITEQKLYSRFIELYLTACVPQLQLQCFQFGWGGETAGGFQRRMDNDLAVFKPNVVTTCYGMNDGGYRPYEPGIGKNYEDPMRQIITKLKAAGATLVVGGPGAVDTKYFRRNELPPQVYNENLTQLTGIARKLAEENGFPFANVHAAMVDAMTKAKAGLGEDYDVCGRDGFHPGPNGHLIMAYAFLKAMGLDGNIGTITVDIKGIATGSEGHKVLAATDGKIELESSRYPFCFFGDEKSSGGTRSIVPYLPFNQDLNRLTLIVKNLPGATAKVTWGEATKSFPREQLERGINLAAEFLQNPFSDAFANLDRAVSGKQEFETFMIKDVVTRFPSLLARSDNDPEVKAALEVVKTKALTRREKMAQAATAALTPVKHTITIASE